MAFNKLKKLLVTGLTIATMTGMVFEYMSNHPIEKPDISAEDTAYIENLIDNTNFEDEKQVEDLANEINNYGNNVVLENEALESFEKATLVRVVDGDTIVVEINSEEYKVRLIGINTPESVAPENYRTPNSEEGKLASEWTKDYLADVETVYLQKDVSDTDRYGRLLRYVWIDMPTDEKDIAEVETKMLNGILVYNGIAEVTTYAPDVLYSETFETIYEGYLNANVNSSINMEIEK